MYMYYNVYYEVSAIYKGIILVFQESVPHNITNILHLFLYNRLEKKEHRNFSNDIK